MFNINKKINDKIVDIKPKLNQIVFALLILFFPLNQQYHFRPFPSVEGFIIDYLIVKISIIELLIISIVIFNFSDVLNILKKFIKKWYFWGFLLIIFQSILRSDYFLLALYESLILLLIVLLGFLFFKNQELLNKPLLVKSIKFWLIILSILGIIQFVTQESVFDNYALTGEFPYNSDYYHIKQKGLIFDESIPPYSIFSHSNIFGAYIIFLLIFLRVFNKDSIYFYFLVAFDLVIIGSSACMLAFVVFIISLKLKTKYVKYLILGIPVVLLGIYFLNSYKYLDFREDSSVYRRLYMFDLSSSKFIESPEILLFGSGYFNYFNTVKSDLYRFELVRFFQPPHFSVFLIIWNYGILFILLLLFLIYRNLEKINLSLSRVLLVIVVLIFFDHYLITNHQIKVLLMLLIPYSLKIKNSI